jgi:hypothetical protein
MGELIEKARVEKAARMYNSCQHAEEALGLASGSFGRLCRRYGIPSPGNKRGGIATPPDAPDPAEKPEEVFRYNPAKPRLDLRDIGERMRGGYVLTRPQLKLLWACYEALPVRTKIRRSVERRLENYAQQRD